MTAFKTIIKEFRWRYKAYRKLIKNKQSFLYSLGWMESLENGEPVDSFGNPIPWMNYNVINLLDNRLKEDMTLFEYGSGNSTHFFANRVNSVTSVEHDESWFNKGRVLFPNNVELRFQVNDIDGDYCRVISLSDTKYDVVIVDGRDRVNCVKQSISALSSRGIILLDDSDREEYQKAFDHAKEHDFQFLNLQGIKATRSNLYQCTIFYREENCLDL